VDYSRLDGQRNIVLEDVKLDKRIIRDFKAQYRVTFLEAVDWLLRKVFKKK